MILGIPELCCLNVLLFCQSTWHNEVGGTLNRHLRWKTRSKWKVAEKVATVTIVSTITGFSNAAFAKVFLQFNGHLFNSETFLVYFFYCVWRRIELGGKNAQTVQQAVQFSLWSSFEFVLNSFLFHNWIGRWLQRQHSLHTKSTKWQPTTATVWWVIAGTF